MGVNQWRSGVWGAGVSFADYLCCDGLKNQPIGLFEIIIVVHLSVII